MTRLGSGPGEVGPQLAGWLLGLALGWVGLWAGPGWAWGDLVILLRPQPPEPLRWTYLVGLYLWLLGWTGWSSWRAGGALAGSAWRPPRARAFAWGVALALAGGALQRAALWVGSGWTPPALEPAALLGALGLAPAVALVEEIVFRGFLFERLRAGFGRRAAYLGAGLLFSVVHLFRPGPFKFKLAYGLGLFLVAIVLCRAYEASRALWLPVGLHTGWILFVILDPPGGVAPGWFAGLEGDPAAGLLGWALLLGLLPWIGALGGRLSARPGGGGAGPRAGPGPAPGA